ncbi:MAG: DEAD/DEAH box helicase, partial [Opitutaceae bacterium]|nr:DEAD/DEAH box helicase [Opitutaceae bacterium]
MSAPAANQVPYRAKHVGVCPPARGAAIDALVRAHPAPVWIIVAENARLAAQLAEDIAFFQGAGAPVAAPADVLVFPEAMPGGRDMREAFAASADRLTVLSALRARRDAGECGVRNAVPSEATCPPCGIKGSPASDANGSGSSPIPPSAIRLPHSLIILTTPAALLHPVPALEQFASAELTLARGQSQSFQGLIEKLRGLDYDSEAVCEAPGHYAVRGGIIDVYPVTATQPCRLDFFGDEIEDIRAFDPVTQRSGESLASITLSATPRVRLASSKTGIAGYLPSRATNLLLVEPTTLEAGAADTADAVVGDGAEVTSDKLQVAGNSHDTGGGEMAGSGEVASGKHRAASNNPGGSADATFASLDAVSAVSVSATPGATPSGNASPNNASPDGNTPAAGAIPRFLDALFPKLSALIGLSDLDEATALFDTPGTHEITWDTESLSHHRSYPSDGLIANERLQAEEDARARFLAQVAAWSVAGCDLSIVTAKEGEENRAKEILAAVPALRKLRPRYLRGALNEGFRIVRRGTGCQPYGTRAARPPTTLSVAGSSGTGFQPVGLGGTGDSPVSDIPDVARITSPCLPDTRKHGQAARATQSAKHTGESPVPLNPPPAADDPAAPAIPRSQIFVTETELFGRQRPRRPGVTAAQRRLTAQRAQVDQLLDFSELVEGDYVVHLQHGIAHYRGLARVEHAGGSREVISLEFDDGVTLHVPLQESHLISRYVGLGKTRPQLGRVGSGRWEKTRRAAEVATIDLAAELLRVQASREARPGHAFDPDGAWQKEFEASFPFTETRDQLRAIDETKADMERPRPMDRLICGDVGFGKTEVAIRAAFKAVQSGRQVALLVPTTVLAQQHLNTFRERMAGYPVNIEMVSRFRTRAEQNKIIAATAAGQVDILIGTHRLLQKDIAFRELGLVIIDEEQRFGVKHKETLKAMRATVDVLSMSATPIPRTLYMALTGARDMSVIETAPVNRHPVETIVKTYDEKIVTEAVRHEVRRGGQVFYLHNRVQTIDLVAARLRQLLPGLRIGVGHGQMDEKELERVMTDFVAGKHDVLVCTTIIESGLDIPNCNTIIIEGADRFGLSQLYQLRGRVGRFKHQAYAYLLLHRH